MARSGSFGTSLNPFGTGSFGNLSQYSIGDNLKDLAAYSTEIAWGNGTITDAQYQASLRSLVSAADPGTQALLSAQNKLDDVTYRIGRSKAEAAGLDALIAFDQQALSEMNSGNLRYRDLKSSLDSELAQRRSRDYGVLVDAYNAGQTSTESLLAWVQNTLSALPADAPDKDNWDSVNATLTGRLADEKDTQIYQDYQDRKITPADFLAYLTGRRDAVDPSSPQWDTANQRLLDAQKHVKDTAQAAIDQDVADKYSNGKISDNTYLVYLQKRVAAMDPGDPALPAWKQRFTQAAHSLAEDKLRTDVSLAKTATAQNAAVANLRSFYQSYALTLNPGSAEYRATMVSINALKPAATPSSGGGGGVAKPAGPAAFVDLTGKIPKIILSTASFDAALGMLTPDANAPKAQQTVIVDFLRGNLRRADTALSAGDKVWLYSDPRYPGQTVTMRNPDGTTYRDANGKSVLTLGSSYRATSSDEVAGMHQATAVYQYSLAALAFANGKTAAGETAKWHGDIAMDAVRATQAHAVMVDTTHQLAALDAAIVTYTGLNDPLTVVALLREKLNVVAQALDETGTMDQAQTDRLNAIVLKVESNPLLPVYLPGADGKNAVGADGRYIQIGGAVNIDASSAAGRPVLNPGYHYLLSTDLNGNAAWEYKWEDPMLGTWGYDHVTIQTGRNGRVVTGEVLVKDAPVLGLWVTTADGTRKLLPFLTGAKYISYVDGYGNEINAYSFDGGTTWVQATGGVHPVLELQGRVNWNDDPSLITDATGKPLFAANGSIDPSAARSVGWYGQAAAENSWDTSAGVGAPGQQFRISTLTAGPDGLPTLNFIPAETLYAMSPTSSPQRVANVIATAEGRALPKPPTPQQIVNVIAATEGRGDPFAVGAAVSSMVFTVASAVQGILHIGANIPAAEKPPSSLPPVVASEKVPTALKPPTPQQIVNVIASVERALPALKPVSTAPPALAKPAVPKPAVPKPVVASEKVPTALKPPTPQQIVNVINNGPR